VSSPIAAQTVLSHRIFTGITTHALGGLVAELAGPWSAREQSRLDQRRGHDRLRAEGGGPRHELNFVDRVIATLVVLRTQLPHAALAVLYQVDRSTISRAVHEIRPLLAARGCAVPGQPGLRLRTLSDLFAYAAAEGVELRIDGTEVQVRRPKAHRAGRRAFVSGKKKQNTKKATVIGDGAGRLLFAGVFRPGRQHDVTALRTDGIEDLITRYPEVKAKVDSGYQGLARDFPDQIQAPPLKPARTATDQTKADWETRRHEQSSQRICIEHTIAEPKAWRTLQRYIGRREYFDETFQAIAGLVSDRTAMR
jgi:hypothetical protein